MPLIAHSSSGCSFSTFEDAIAEQGHGLGRPHSSQVLRVRGQEGNHAAAVRIVDSLEDPDLAVCVIGNSMALRGGDIGTARRGARAEPEAIPPV
jgi:hypothetical protein